MKRLFLLLLLTSLLLFACATGTEQDTNQDTEPGMGDVDVAGEETAAAGETDGAIAGTPERQETPEMQEAGAPDTDETPATGAAGGTVDVASSEELGGEYLVDGQGMSLYLFHGDEQGSEASTCSGNCAQVWPPFTVDDQPTSAADAIDESLLGAIEREDGTQQVTYNGWPLYYFQRDQQPGDTNGHDIEGFGAEWYLITPEGTELESESESES